MGRIHLCYPAGLLHGLVRVAMAGKRARVLAQVTDRAIGPQVPGGRYFCGYWQAEYTVDAIACTLDGTALFTVTWADGRRGSHCTAWDARADRVVRQAG
jgi:hypothetical protein